MVVQKYLHDLDAWARRSTEEQEAVVGRTKADDVELDDAAGPQLAHKTLATIVGDDGEELEILRDNMPFGRPGQGEFGTYFIGYTRRLWVIQLMIKRMFVGQPPGFHDRILDVSTAVTGTTFSTATSGSWPPWRPRSDSKPVSSRRRRRTSSCAMFRPTRSASPRA